MVNQINADSGIRRRSQTFRDLVSAVRFLVARSLTCQCPPDAPKGNKNPFKHGRYAADAIANRREIASLLQTMRALTRTTGI
jgi:hypothetical protein